jgi:diguanylate cyclase (GGDEF)-like protein/PAS domain S-box-containing protein
MVFLKAFYFKPRGAAISIFKRKIREKVNVPFLEYLREAIVILSRDGQILEANSTFASLAGMRKEALVGLDCRSVGLLAPLWNSVTVSLLNNSEQKERIPYQGCIFDASVYPIISSGEINHVSIALRDITDIVALEKQFEKRNRELVIANILTSAFISSSNLETVYGELLETILLVCGVNMGWIVLKHEDGFAIVARQGISSGFKEKIEEDMLYDIYAKAFSLERPYYVLDARSSEMPEIMQKEGFSFFATLPLRVGEDRLGLVALASRTEVDFEFDAASLLSLMGNTMSLIAEKIILFQKTQRMAVTDPLTGLFNMRHFYRILDSEVQRTERYGIPFSLVLFDIDNFKSLNDTYGHQVGDDLIRNVSTQMLKTLRKTDTLARFGGEEFITLLTNTEKDEALHLAERLKEAAEIGITIEGKILSVTLSGGVASFPEDAKSGKELLHAADMSMYDSKAAGKNQITCYTKKK